MGSGYRQFFQEDLWAKEIIGFFWGVNLLERRRKGIAHSATRAKSRLNLARESRAQTIGLLAQERLNGLLIIRDLFGKEDLDNPLVRLDLARKQFQCRRVLLIEALDHCCVLLLDRLKLGRHKNA